MTTRATKTKPVEPTVWTRLITYLIRGTYDLLMHNPASMSMSTPSGELKGASDKNIPTAEEEAARSRYLTEDGLLWIPAVAFPRSFATGLKGKRVDKTSVN